MASSASSFFIAWLFLRGSSIYTIKLEKRGVKLRMGRSFILDFVRVEDVMSKNVVTVASDMPLSALEILFEEYHHIGYPVVEKGRLVEMVTLSDLKKVPPSERYEKKVVDVATKNLVVTYPEESMHTALDKMYEHDVSRLPIMNGLRDLLSVIFNKTSPMLLE